MTIKSNLITLLGALLTFFGATCSFKRSSDITARLGARHCNFWCNVTVYSVLHLH